jgi:hypothetical protein
MSFAQKMVSGSVTKHVSCTRCGRPYQYELERTVIGKSSKGAATTAEAQAQASQDADAKLAANLASGCDLVACPACGAITQEMKTYRLKFFGATFACLGFGIAALAAVYLGSIYLHRIYLYPAAGGALCLLLGIALFVVGIMKVAIPKKAKL